MDIIQLLDNIRNAGQNFFTAEAQRSQRIAEYKR
jgi:hypothetical protein